MNMWPLIKKTNYFFSAPAVSCVQGGEGVSHTLTVIEQRCSFTLDKFGSFTLNYPIKYIAV